MEDDGEDINNVDNDSEGMALLDFISLMFSNYYNNCDLNHVCANSNSGI